MKPLAAILITLLSAAPAWADISATLAVKPDSPAAGDFRPVDLTITNTTDTTIAAVELTPSGGGMTIRYPLAVPPGQQGRLEVLLPPIWPLQQYVVKALDASGKQIGSATAGVDWPAEMLATGRFIDDSFNAFRSQRAAWPDEAKSNLLLLGMIYLVPAAGLLLIRRPLWRAGGLVLLTALATAATLVLPLWPPAVQMRSCYVETYDSAGQGTLDSFTVAAARRDADLTYQAGQPPHLVYIDRTAAAEDTSVLRPADKTLSLHFAAGNTKIIRPAAGESPLRPLGRGSFRRQDGQVRIQADDIRRGLLLDGGYFWLVAPGQENFEPSKREIIWSLLGKPSDYGLTPGQAQIFEYWRQSPRRPTSQPGGRLYLIHFPTDNRIVVQDLDEETPTTAAIQAG